MFDTINKSLISIYMLVRNQRMNWDKCGQVHNVKLWVKISFDPLFKTEFHPN